MKDLYEVLGVACDAEDSTIRTAYRKAALRWHPGVLAVSLLPMSALATLTGVDICA